MEDQAISLFCFFFSFSRLSPGFTLHSPPFRSEPRLLALVTCARGSSLRFVLTDLAHSEASGTSTGTAVFPEKRGLAASEKVASNSLGARTTVLYCPFCIDNTNFVLVLRWSVFDFREKVKNDFELGLSVAAHVSQAVGVLQTTVVPLFRLNVAIAIPHRAQSCSMSERVGTR